MDNIKDSMTKLFANKNSVLIIVAVVLFLVIAIYVYINYVQPTLTTSYVPNKEFVLGGTENTNQNVADLYFFYTDWCPHCKKAKPIWNQLKDEVDGNSINNVTVNFFEVDCDKDEATASKFKITGYPTIKLVYNDQIIEYDAKPELNTLHQFLSTSLI
tara:strand:+ start:538 stop:1011 length:474 start_codon:yes stop_codon:yes gene_type:complete